MFFNAVMSGSWYMKVLEAGHASFFKAPWLIQKAADLLCHRGRESHEVIRAMQNDEVYSMSSCLDESSMPWHCACER